MSDITYEGSSESLSSLDFSRKLTNEGIQKAVDSANRVHEKWSDKAFAYLEWYVSTRKPGERFLCEDIRESSSTLVPLPPSDRAWGAIIMKAIKARLILQVGYAKVKNAKAHRANASIYVKM